MIKSPTYLTGVPAEKPKQLVRHSWLLNCHLCVTVATGCNDQAGLVLMQTPMNGAFDGFTLKFSLIAARSSNTAFFEAFFFETNF